MPSSAVASSTGGSQAPAAGVSTAAGARSSSADRIANTARSAPSRSALLITNRSPISISPAFIACTVSPDSGTSTTAVESAVCATSSSLCPTPTVSMRTREKPAASSTSHTWAVWTASPPMLPRVAIERMNTPGSPASSPIRTRSPSRAPPLKGLVGSTATIATVSPRRRHAWARRATSVLLPAPGGPVMPTRNARPLRAKQASRIATASGASFSTREMARASATRSPSRAPRISSSWASACTGFLGFGRAAGAAATGEKARRA